MKKLKLKALELGARELLSREQLKNVIGGSGTGSEDPGSNSGSGDCVNDKFEACKGKGDGDACCFIWNGSHYPGKCRAFAPDYKFHCSDLN